ncbi:MAG: polysaccharide deacetylase family protein [Lentisphaeria bacterium]
MSKSFPPEILFAYPNWKRKALTFSYDDGVTDDRRLVSIFNKYNMKATFNLNGGRCGSNERFITLEEIKSLYEGHEIAGHSLNHPHMEQLSKQNQLQEISKDKSVLEDASSQIITGFAYPFGTYSEDTIEALEENNIVYARTIKSTFRYSLPVHFLKWHPTAHHSQNIAELGKKYIPYQGSGGNLTILYIWGHSFEFGRNNSWDIIENFCSLMANKEDIWYVTNGDFVEYMTALQKVRTNINSTLIENTSSINLYLYSSDNDRWMLAPGETLNTETKTIRKPQIISKITPAHQGSGKKESFLTYPNGLRKALTFSYDDGRADDDRLLAIFNNYGMKGTFNLNGSKINPVEGNEYIQKYTGHEISTHGFKHRTFRSVPPAKILEDLYQDRLTLEKYTASIIDGNALPNGTNSSFSCDIKNILKSCGILYSRGTLSTLSFDLPIDFIPWEPTAHHQQQGDLCEIGTKFLDLEVNGAPKVCYIWGHSYEFGNQNNWEIMENFCNLMAKKQDIWYATNGEIARYILAARKLIWSQDKSMVYNPTSTTIWYFINGTLKTIAPGRTSFQ